MPTTSESRIIDAAQDDVWAALADIENAGRWNTAWQRIELTSSQRQGPGATFRAHTEDGASFDFQITHWAPPDYIAFSPLVQEDATPYLITLESQAFLLRPAPDGRTNVQLSASARSHSIRGWFLARFFWPGYQKHGLRRALDALQSLFEPLDQPEQTGETSSQD